MSYVKTVWETGDVITAEKLNNIENGISGASDICRIAKATKIPDDPDENWQLDKTYNELKTAYLSGFAGVQFVDDLNPNQYKVVPFYQMSEDTTQGEEFWSVECLFNDLSWEFSTDTEGGTLKTNFGE